jgi:hypothetical protein
VSYVFDDDDDELDAVGMCPHNCGMRRQHKNPKECLNDMRDAIAGLQFQVEGLIATNQDLTKQLQGAGATNQELTKKLQAAGALLRGPRAPRRDRRLVVVHGELMDLEAAAAAMGTTRSGLANRLARRRAFQAAGGVVDLDALGMTEGSERGE